MGYTTDFDGQVNVVPPLNQQEIHFLTKFSESRRMDREKGPYYLGTGDFGQDRENDIRNYNRPPEGQPGLWCNWQPTSDGSAIEWSGAEKFYSSMEWMQYLIDHFIGSNPIAKQLHPEEFSFLQSHTLNGEIGAQGEDRTDKWTLIVTDNIVTTRDEEPDERDEDDDEDEYY